MAEICVSECGQYRSAFCAARVMTEQMDTLGETAAEQRVRIGQAAVAGLEFAALDPGGQVDAVTFAMLQIDGIDQATATKVARLAEAVQKVDTAQQRMQDECPGPRTILGNRRTMCSSKAVPLPVRIIDSFS